MTKIHSTAIVEDGAQLGADVEVGAYSVIGANVKIGAGTQIRSHVVIDGDTTIGEACHVFPFACLGTQTQDLKFCGGKTSVVIGDRTTFREYVTVNSGTHEGEVTRVGSDCTILAYCHVAHACEVGNGVIMSNGATLAGDVIVEDQAIIGGLTGVHQFTRIGRLCMVGGCSKIVKDCPPFMIVDGHPPRVRGVNTIGMERKGFSAESRDMLKKAHRVLFRKGFSTQQALEEIRGTLTIEDELEHLLTFIESSKRGILK
jgi:UDP-N-acetylglucosamine acyltransferase